MPKVFLIEQDPSLREWCRLHLGTEGFAVVPFDDARRALEALRVEPPELVMIATNIMGMSAFALAAAIRSNVAVTSSTGDTCRWRRHALMSIMVAEARSLSI